MQGSGELWGVEGANIIRELLIERFYGVTEAKNSVTTEWRKMDAYITLEERLQIC